MKLFSWLIPLQNCNLVARDESHEFVCVSEKKCFEEIELDFLLIIIPLLLFFSFTVLVQMHSSQWEVFTSFALHFKSREPDWLT